MNPAGSRTHPCAHPPGATLRALVLLIALVALAIPAFVVVHAPTIAHPGTRLARLPHHVVPATIVPSVEPVAFINLPPDEARAYNASIPFSTDPIPAARAFRLRDGADDLARATDCLATAVLYEAGADPEGQRAVAQVVVNRVRHPAFPKTICGVVFEGEERSTGCQFSFSCDHALTRWTPTPAMWTDARKVAAAALAGAVYRPVGYATHYHTDWVVPYWQSSLDKIARVHSHLFFRWSGWWGTPPAFDRQVAATEPAIAQLALVSEAHRTAATAAEADAAIVEANAALGFAMEVDPALAVAAPSTPAPVPDATGEPTTFLVKLDPRQPADGYRTAALSLCADRPHCTVMGWTDAAAKPDILPMTPVQMAAMTFSYLRDRPTGFERSLWNCTEVRRAQPSECMKRQPTPRIDVPTPAPPASPGSELEGIHRRAAAPPSATKTSPRP